MSHYTVMAALLGVTAATPIQQAAPSEPMMLANFHKGHGTHNPHVYTWSEQNDPVMGGQSTGNFTVVKAGEDSHALFQGDVKNVSFLHAPGYCRITTIFPGGHTVDASEYKDGALQLVVKNGQHTLPGSEYAGFKVAVSSPKAARHHGGHELFGMYKANFEFGKIGPVFPIGHGWDAIIIPFSAFSSDWSDFTGECKTKDPDGYQHKCCETGQEDICPSTAGLGKINGLSVWAEGVEGEFQLQVKSISAVALGPDGH